jgi:hypothetical protein
MTATLSGVSRMIVYTVMSAYTNHRKSTSVNRSSEQKSTMTERECRTLRMKNHITIALQVTAELNMYSSWRPCFHKNCLTWASQIQHPTAIDNLWLLKVMLRCINDGVTVIKPGHQATGNAHIIWSDESSFMLFPTLGKVYVWRTPKEAYNLECLVPIVEHGIGSVMVWVFCWSHYYPLWLNYCKGVCGQVG